MEIHGRLGNTVIAITHDVDEAVLLADRIVMMTNGPAATIGQVLRVELPRPRKRLELTKDPTTSMPARSCCASSTSATARPRLTRPRTRPPAADRVGPRAPLPALHRGL